MKLNLITRMAFALDSTVLGPSSFATV